MLPSGNHQNRTNFNAMVTMKMCGWEGFMYCMCDKHGDNDHDHNVVGWK